MSEQIDLDAIEEAAREASSGPYSVVRNDGIPYVSTPYGWVCKTYDVDGDDAQHIANCGPDTILKLVAVVRAAKDFQKVSAFYGYKFIEYQTLSEALKPFTSGGG